MIAKMLAASLFAVAALPAAATLPDMQPMELRYAGGNLTMNTRLSLPVGGTLNYQIGNYRFETRNPDDSFVGYCADPFQWANGSYREYAAMPLADHVDDAARYANVTRLFGHAYADTLISATKAAGFQLALWEVFNDDGNLGSGKVKVAATSNAGIVAEAQSLLAALPGWTDVGTTYDLRFYANGTYQDYIGVAGLVETSVPAIPEPEQYALLLAGLGVLGWTVRRRKS
jgi:hypothetical protein